MAGAFGASSADLLRIPPKPDTSCTDVDYKGVIYGTQLAIHFMRKNQTPGGCIVATSSIAALYPFHTFPEYAGAKAAKHNIRINAVLPGTVPTNIMPKAMVDAWGPEQYGGLATEIQRGLVELMFDSLTPASTVTAAYMKLLDDNTLNGQAIECSIDKHIFSHHPEYLDGWFSKRSLAVWDPLFEAVHGEKSGLPDAIA
ncbi:hypothetical protein LTR28_006100 [Elasticomyces elasticus]|nr:hypothetical protein LTR28_006100 [Elasticomyces elasticus]